MILPLEGKSIIPAILIIAISILINGCQSTPDVSISADELEQHIRYLASDELKGRKTGYPELDTAAAYISEHFHQYQLKRPENRNDHFQVVELHRRQDNTDIRVSINDQPVAKNDLIYIQGAGALENASLIWLDQHDMDNTEAPGVKDKIVVTNFGLPGDHNMRNYMMDPGIKRERLLRQGARGLIEVYDHHSISWARLNRMVSFRHTQLYRGESYHQFLHLILNKQNRAIFSGSPFMTVVIDLKDTPAPIVSKNVIGIVEGTHPIRNKEYVMITAHYDHIGIGKPVERLNGELDSIYNGARDNAIGVAALMVTARTLAESRPDRSVILMACTAEEIGLLGSAWFVEHPVVPLHKIVFNFNIDGMGYNDTGIASVFGLERTTAKDMLKRACSEYGLEAYTTQGIDDNLYRRSDNLNFARKGIPSITFSQGFTHFDQAIRRYYHQAIDEPDSLDYEYLKKWTGALVQSVRYIADMEAVPAWRPGEVYEDAARSLYGTKNSSTGEMD
jgi:hypothetical protein